MTKLFQILLKKNKLFNSYFDKLCAKSIALSLRLVFQSILNDEVFPDDWKKSPMLKFVLC